jgi:hypothetical protein
MVLNITEEFFQESIMKQSMDSERVRERHE